MIGIARLADRGPMAAAGVAAALLLGGLMSFVLIGPFMVVPVTLSAAVVSFVVLRRGEGAALRAGSICFAVLVLVSALLLRSAIAIPVTALTSWLPAVGASIVLRRTGSLSLALLSISAIGVVGVLLLTLATGDPAAFWSAEMQRMMAQLNEQGGLGLDGAEVAPVADALAFWMTGAAGLSLFLTALAALFVARSWQAKLVNPGGFRSAFHELSLGKPTAGVAIGAIVLAAVTGGPVATAIAMVIGAAFVVQGMAVLHALVAQRGLSPMWLGGLYATLLIPQAWLLIAALGLLDNQLNLRRLPSSPD